MSFTSILLFVFVCDKLWSTAVAQLPVPTEWNVRLSEGYYGRVDVQYSGTWGTICNKFWSTGDCEVTCRELGLSGGIDISPDDGFYDVATSGPIWLSKMKCDGDEDHLYECDTDSTFWGDHNCDHSRDAGCSCMNPNPLSDPKMNGYKVSLSEGWEGNILVTYDGQQGTVCDDYLNDQVCRVACRESGFNYTNGNFARESRFGAGSGPIWLDNVDCDGDEDHLYECVHNGWGIHNCDHNDDAGCTCDQPPAEECICRVRGDPIMEPCDFGIRMLRGEESYDLANYNGSDCSFTVRINTTEIEPGLVIPTDMEFEVPMGGDRYKILRDKELSKNGVEVVDPENFSDTNIECKLSDNGLFLVCSPNDCGARFAFYGVGTMSETLIILPGELVDGVTGECNKEE